MPVSPETVGAATEALGVEGMSRVGRRARVIWDNVYTIKTNRMECKRPTPLRKIGEAWRLKTSMSPRSQMGIGRIRARDPHGGDPYPPPTRITPLNPKSTSHHSFHIDEHMQIRLVRGLSCQRTPAASRTKATKLPPKIFTVNPRERRTIAPILIAPPNSRR